MLHPVSQKILALIKKTGYWYESFEHEPVRTSEEAAKIRTGYSFHQGAKAMILKYQDLCSNGENKFVMLVFPADLKFNNRKVKELLSSKNACLASEEEISFLTDGVEIGGVPPFGNLFGLRVLADEKLFANEKIIFNAGDRRLSVAIKSQDYKRLVKPQIVNIV